VLSCQVPAVGAHDVSKSEEEWGQKGQQTPPREHLAGVPLDSDAKRKGIAGYEWAKRIDPSLRGDYGPRGNHPTRSMSWDT